MRERARASRPAPARGLVAPPRDEAYDIRRRLSESRQPATPDRADEVRGGRVSPLGDTRQDAPDSRPHACLDLHELPSVDPTDLLPRRGETGVLPEHLFQRGDADGPRHGRGPSPAPEREEPRGGGGPAEGTRPHGPGPRGRVAARLRRARQGLAGPRPRRGRTPSGPASGGPRTGP